MAKTTSIDTFQEKPTLRINADELPQIEKWSIDGEYTLTLKVKMRNVGKNDYDKNPKTWATFTVEDVKTDDDDDFVEGLKSVKPTRITKK